MDLPRDRTKIDDPRPRRRHAARRSAEADGPRPRRRRGPLPASLRASAHVGAASPHPFARDPTMPRGRDDPRRSFRFRTPRSERADEATSRNTRTKPRRGPAAPPGRQRDIPRRSLRERRDRNARTKPRRRRHRGVAAVSPRRRRDDPRRLPLPNDPRSERADEATPRPRHRRDTNVVSCSFEGPAESGTIFRRGAEPRASRPAVAYPRAPPRSPRSRR